MNTIPTERWKKVKVFSNPLFVYPGKGELQNASMNKEDNEENWIKYYRELKGLSMEQLADKANTTNQQINYLEKGQRKLTWLWMKRLAKALDCSPLEIAEGPLNSNSSSAEVAHKYLYLSETEKEVFTNMLDSIYMLKKEQLYKNREKKTKRHEPT